MSLQQGAAGVRCLIARPNTGFFARYRRSPNILGVFGAMSGRRVASARRPNAAPMRILATRCRSPRVTRPPVTAMAFLAVSLTQLCDLNLARLDLKQSFKRQPFQALTLRSVLAGPTPPPIWRLTVAISRVFERW